jgi:uncharacterized protein (TIGR01777 family)
MNKFVKEEKIAVSQETLFDWHESSGAFQRLTPNWEKVNVKFHEGGIKDGALVKLTVNVLGPIALPWHLTHKDYKKPEQFIDQQIIGMFDQWKHCHIMKKLTDKESVLIDDIGYKLPLGALGNFFGKAFVENKLERLFRFRHNVTKHEAKIFEKRTKTMKILVVGARGLVGDDLVSFLRHQNHDVFRLSRTKKNFDNDVVLWDPKAGVINEADLDGFDAVINLAGENIAAKRWTTKQKQEIRDSRIESTTLIVDALTKVKNPPKVFICASAIGFYGDRPNEVVNESSFPARGDFLSDTCKEWEQACQPAVDLGIRVVNARFGIILSPKGGALAKLLLPFQLGLGGQIGDGKQFMSWISLDDVVYALNFALQNESVSGPVNFTAPNPVTNLEFTKVLGKVLQRPVVFPVPSFAAKLVFGEMADALLLSSQKVNPSKLMTANYEFAYPDLESALRQLLGK